MMLTDDAVESALAALRSPHLLTGADGGQPADPLPACRPTHGALARDVIDRVSSAPVDRSGEVARARAWLDEGRVPDAAFVANALVGRLVCDRLR